MAFHLQISKFICVVLFLGTVAAHAETLDQLTAEALRNNPELCVIEQSVITARGGVTTAQTYANPELTLAPGVKRVREAGNSTSEFHGIFELSQPFKFPGKRALEIAIARRSFQSQEIALEALRFQLAVKVRRAFYESLAAQNALGVRGEQVEAARTFAAAAQKRVESGFAGDFETVKSLADLIAARKAERQAEGRLATARVALNTLVGRAPTAPLKISGTQESVGPRGSLPDFTALALARNPALLAQNAEAEKAGLNLHLARFGNRPDFAIGPSVEYAETEQIYGLSATIALPFWDRKRGEIAAATAGQKKALAEIEKLRLEIRAEVARAGQELDLAKEQLALYSPKFLDRLKAFVRQAEEGYAQSATTLIIYLDAKRTYFDTLTDYYEALGNVARARAELESAVGVPLELNP